MKKMGSGKLTLYIFLFIIFSLFIIGLLLPQTQPQEQEIQPTILPTTTRIPDVPYESTLEGTVVCLPHKDTSGPQTLECAIGLQTSVNEFYALDANGENPPPYKTGQRIRAQGIITPAEMLSADRWHKYNMKGIFSFRSKVTIL